MPSPAWPKFFLSVVFLALIIPGFFPEASRNTVSDVQAGGVNLANTLQAAVLGAGSFLLLLVFLSRTRYFRVFSLHPVRLYLAFVAFSVASSTYSIAPFQSFAKSLFLASGAFLTFGLIAFDLHLPKGLLRDRIAELWGFFYMLVVAFCLITAVAQISAPAYQIGLPGTEPRLSGGQWFYWAPNLISQLAATVLVIAFFRAIIGRFHGGTLIVFAAAVYLMITAHSRTPLLPLAVALVFLGRYARRSLWSYVLLTFMAIGIVFSIGVFAGVVEDWILRTQTVGELLGGTGRVNKALIALQIFRQNNPILGVGYYVGSRTLIGPTASNIDNTHLDVLVNTGLAGYTLFLAFTLALVVGLWRRRKLILQPGNEFMVEIGLALLIVAVRSVTGPTYHRLDFNLVFVAFGSFLLFLGSASNRGASGVRRRRRPVEAQRVE